MKDENRDKALGMETHPGEEVMKEKSRQEAISQACQGGTLESQRTT